MTRARGSRFGSDVRFALRLLARHPGHTTLASLTIALGLGATVAVSSVAHAVLLRPLPYADESRVVMVWETDPAQGYPKKAGTPGNFLDWRARSHSFEHLAALAPYEATLTGAGEPARLTGRRVSASIFLALGAMPALGRPFNAGDERPGHEVAIISHRVWIEYFGGDPTLVGRRIQLNDSPMTLVGVMGPDFRLPDRQDDVLIPFVFTDFERQARGSHFLNVVARLARNVTLEQAQADMDMVAAWLAREFPRPNAKEGALVEPIREHIVGDVRTALVVITGAALLVLLIGCVNVANLQLARGLTRQREISVRMALGAGRLRIVAQLLTESMILAIIGGALGLLVAVAGVEAFRYVLPPALQSIAEPEIDGRLLAFAALMALGTGVLFGLAPAVQTSSTTPGVADGSRSAGSAGGARVRQILVAAEIALALVLLVGSGLLLRSFTRLSSVDPGFATDRRLTFRVELPRGRYGEPAQWAPFLDSLVERIESLPGVRAAGGTSWLPLTEAGGSNAIFVEGRPLPAPGQALFATYRLATPHYFRAVGIPVLQGRTFDDTDGLGSPRVTVINQTMATRLWPGEDPIGKRVTFARAPGPTDWITVVGVIGDAKLGGLAAPVSVAMYSAHTQEPYWTPPSHFVVHTTGDPLAMAATIREQVRALDPRLPVSDVKTMSAILREHVSAPRFQSVLIGAFGATALVLAWIGIYGLLAFAVASRRREIGVRTALGASPREIVRMVLASGARIAGAGLGIGLLAAFLLSRWLETLLFEIEPADAPTFAASACAMIALALLACYVPARRAARVDPVSALKAE